jgi:hypothetical protein
MSATIEVTTTQPSQLEQMAQAVFQNLKALREAHRNQILAGAGLAAPTTPSSQLTASGNTTWNVNISALLALVGGALGDLAAQTDLAIHSASWLTGLTSGKSCVAAIVLKNVTGTVTCVAVKGTPATTGSQVAPSDTVIQAAVGAGVPWIVIGYSTLNRTGDTAVTEAEDNSYRPLLGVNWCSEFGDF